ncbi:MAG: integral membrane sensor signal transduction histidine kinase [Microgenomates group bacterium Gr01-1014_93]|nr:MAG: integral membrane sensor signal transduction histidine kinase [Microgenomates group bacterium Gr01-1014_93]
MDPKQFAFVSIAAHELRTPLTSIKGYLSVLTNEYGSKMSPDEANLVKGIQTATDELYSLVENLLSVSRVERGALSIKTEALDYLNLVSETVNEFKTRANQKGISLELVPIKDKIQNLSVDKVRIKEVLSNLLSNALFYTPANGMVRVYVSLRGNDVITSVADNGPGIAPEVLPHLFSEFFRAGSIGKGMVNDPNPRGAGLGLFICKSIVDMHKGKIWVESKLGKGSVFSYTLPLFV